METLVDGAHAPGMVPVELDHLGAAFLHVRRDLQRAIHPTVISHGYSIDIGGASFRAEFDWTGTTDPTPWLCIGAAIDYVGSLLPDGWPDVMAANRALALDAHVPLCEVVGVTAPAPASMVGSIASVPLPAPAPGSPAEHLSHEGLMNWFRERGVETWLYPWPCAGGNLIRVSAQLCNGREEYVRLAALLAEALGASGPARPTHRVSSSPTCPRAPAAPGQGPTRCTSPTTTRSGGSPPVTTATSSRC